MGHELPIGVMGDVERMMRRKERFRDPTLSDQENEELFRPYFNNPFKAPGTIGARTEITKGTAPTPVTSKEMADEAFYETAAEDSPTSNYKPISSTMKMVPAAR